MTENAPDWQETHTIWHRITGEPGALLPEADTVVMVYDDDLEDIFLGTVGVGGEVFSDRWFDVSTDEPLPKPTWWADMVFPEDL